MAGVAKCDKEIERDQCLVLSVFVYSAVHHGCSVIVGIVLTIVCPGQGTL